MQLCIASWSGYRNAAKCNVREIAGSRFTAILLETTKTIKDPVEKLTIPRFPLKEDKFHVNFGSAYRNCFLMQR